MRGHLFDRLGKTPGCRFASYRPSLMSYRWQQQVFWIQKNEKILLGKYFWKNIFEKKYFWKKSWLSACIIQTLTNELLVATKTIFTIKGRIFFQQGLTFRCQIFKMSCQFKRPLITTTIDHGYFDYFKGGSIYLALAQTVSPSVTSRQTRYQYTAVWRWYTSADH